MIYSVGNLTQTEDCEVLLSWAAKQRKDLNHQRYLEERQANRYGETSAEIEVRLQATFAEIAAEASAIDSLPDGSSRNKRIFKKKQLEYQLLALEHRQKSYGIVALLTKEMEVRRVDKEIAELDAFIAAVTARKEELAA